MKNRFLPIKYLENLLRLAEEIVEGNLVPEASVPEKKHCCYFCQQAIKNKLWTIKETDYELGAERVTTYYMDDACYKKLKLGENFVGNIYSLN